MIISLGILTQPWQLVVLMLAIILLTLQAIIINRLFGLPLPRKLPIVELPEANSLSTPVSYDDTCCPLYQQRRNSSGDCDSEIQSLLSEGHVTASTILNEHSAQLAQLVQTLLEHE